MLVWIWYIVIVLVIIVIVAGRTEERKAELRAKAYKARAKFSVRSNARTLIEKGKEYRVRAVGLNYITVFDEQGTFTAFDKVDLDEMFEFIPEKREDD